MRSPTSTFRNVTYGALRLYVVLSCSLLVIPVLRMLLSPFICNVAIQVCAGCPSSVSWTGSLFKTTMPALLSTHLTVCKS
jgi:hypothetical protein